MTTKLNVTLTQSYRLSSDGERNFIVEQRVTVDPTKAPGWPAKVAEAAGRGTVLNAEPREEWRDCGNYWPMTAKGLAAALEFVAVRQSVEDAVTSDWMAVDIGEFTQMIRGYSERMRAAVNGLLKSEEATL